MLVIWCLLINPTPLPDLRSWENYNTLICCNHTPATQALVISAHVSRNGEPVAQVMRLADFIQVFLSLDPVKAQLVLRGQC